MPAYCKIVFIETNEEIEWYGGRGYYYELADGTRFKLRTELAWCTSCQDFVDAELIQSLSEIERELVDLRDPTSQSGRMFFSYEPPFDHPSFRDDPVFQERKQRLYQEAIAEATRRIDWRRNRTSPPKCLRCGSTGIELLRERDQMHIPGRGWVRVEWAGMCSTEFANWFFAPEGDRIPRETKPSYWHLPREDE